jgi:hypothetical protein
METKNDFSLIIQLNNIYNKQMVLISVTKYKLLDVLAKLGGLMKIITFVKMTGKFWSSYFYEKSIYDLLSQKKNIYFQKRNNILNAKIFVNRYTKTSFPNNINNIQKSQNENMMNSNYNNTGQNIKEIRIDKINKPQGPVVFQDSEQKSKLLDNQKYVTYLEWLLNRFCKLFYENPEAKKKRKLITNTLGIDNYLLHLDYIDLLMTLDQYSGNLDKKVNDILNESKNKIESENIQLRNPIEKLNS